jgi:predicted acylesterase/phospholipase RssA
MALTMSGAIALGAFEGGALAALLAAVQAANEKQPGALRVDAIAGASAGSITAVLAARTLLAGLDPVATMYGAWVSAPQLRDLRDKSASPLSVEHVRAQAERLLAGEQNPKCIQGAAIRVHMALGCLRGLDYRIGRVGGPPVPANTYIDWAEWLIDGNKPIGWYTSENGPIDAALASGAHAAAFPPCGLDRSAPDIQAVYARNGVEGFPPSKFLWYTDGGTIDNEPLGRALDIAQEQDASADDPLGDAARLHLLLTPDPARPRTGNDVWSTRSPAPSWAMTGLRAVKLLRVQRLYDDLRRVEKLNSRIAWTRQLEATLLPLLEDGGDAAPALEAFIAGVHADKAALDGPDRSLTITAEPNTEFAATLREAFDLATGLSGKRDVAVSVVSPLVLPEVSSGEIAPRELLAGEFLGHFGGFLNESLRENDFALGYRCMLTWLSGDAGLAAHGLDEALAATAIAGGQSARAAWQTAAGREWVTDLGGTTLPQRPLREKLAVWRLAAKAALIAFNQVRRGARR